MFKGKKERKGYSEEKSYQEGLWQKIYSGGQTNNMIKNTGQGWKEIGDDRKEKE